MAGIYIHIPFCKRRCFYCDFYTTVNFTVINDFLNALIVEINSRKKFFNHSKKNINTIYIGGGTPSILTIEQLENILHSIYNNFSVSSKIELTIEANPEHITLQYCKGLKRIGINRLSIGVQSFDNDLLKFLNRRHTVQQAIDCIKYAKQSGIDNISIDLIYGIPGMTIKQWKKILTFTFNLPINHLSAYHLTIEPKTTFGYLKEKGRFQEISDEESFKQYCLLHEIAQDNLFEHYEISNFGKENSRSVHNSNYWLGEPYLGLGPSAHSYNGTIRYFNIDNLKNYIENLKNGKEIFTCEELTEVDRINEYLLLHLRRKEGIDIPLFQQSFGENKALALIKKSEKFIKSKHVNYKNHLLTMSLEGWFISNKIISDLFF